jgi:hypothetical protein
VYVPFDATVVVATIAPLDDDVSVTVAPTEMEDGLTVPEMVLVAA